MEIQEDQIIVGTMFRNQLRWFVTDKTLWRLDYRKYYDDLYAKYQKKGRSLVEFVREIGSFGEFCQSRFRIPLLDKSTAAEFFEKIMLSAADTAELAYLYMRAEESQKSALLPLLYVNFDTKALYSLLPKEDRLEAYVPDGWKGLRQNFAMMIPLKDRYWAEP
ncbi:MAG: hypothetical protein IKI58_01095 [Oscillospiraceae bacterium]|nr:hypothetical protein [Oscillospiraceae bacterium]